MTALQQPSIMDFGAIQLISPDGSHRVSSGLWPELAAAVLLDPEPEELAVWIGRLEEDLGVRPAHRAFLTGGLDAARAAVVSARRGAPLAGPDPIRDPEVLRQIADKLELATEKRVAATAARAAGPAKRRLAKQLEVEARKLEGEARILREEELRFAQLCGDASEPVLLAKIRGEDVDAREVDTADFAVDEHGARLYARKRGRHANDPSYMQPVLTYSRGVRARRLAGVEHAAANGYFGEGPAAERLCSTGVAYRSAYEIAEGCTSTRGEGGSTGFGPKAPQPRLVQAGEDLADMRRGLSRRQRDVLDKVCGENFRVREAATVLGAGFPATLNALRGGLRAAQQSLAAERQKRDDVGAAAAGPRVRSANAMLSQVRTL